MKVNENIRYRVVLGQPVLIDTSGKFKGIAKLNGTASAIWTGLMEGKNESEIVQKLTEEYDVDEIKAASDVKTMIERFKEQGFIED